MTGDYIPTGRGGYVLRSEVSLAELLRRYDRAYPEFTDIPREAVTAAYQAKEAQPC